MTTDTTRMRLRLRDGVADLPLILSEIGLFRNSAAASVSAEENPFEAVARVGCSFFLVEKSCYC